MALTGSTTVQGTPNVDLVFVWTATFNASDTTYTVVWETKLVSNDVGRIDASPGSAYETVVNNQEFTGTTCIAIEPNSTVSLATGSLSIPASTTATSFDYTFSQDFYINLTDGTPINVVSGSGTGILDAISEGGSTTDPEEPEVPEVPEEPTVPDTETISVDIRSFITGYILGLLGRPLPFLTHTTSTEEVTE